MKAKDITQLVVGFMVMIAFLVVLWAVFKIEMPASNRDLALILLGVLATKFGDVVAYNFNSSKGSSEKTDIISKLPPVPPVLLLLIFLIGLASCSTQKPLVTEVPIQYKEKIVERLVPVTVPADSSALFALFECDSANQVIIKDLNETKSKLMQSQVYFQAGKLSYKVKTVRDTVYVPSKETVISKEVPVKVEVIKEVNKLTAWQRGQMHIGRLFLTLIMAYGFYRLLKWKFNLI